MAVRQITLVCFVVLLCMACGILVPLPGIAPGPPGVKAQSPNHWTTREVPRKDFLYYYSRLHCTPLNYPPPSVLITESRAKCRHQFLLQQLALPAAQNTTWAEKTRSIIQPLQGEDTVCLNMILYLYNMLPPPAPATHAGLAF